MNGLEGGTGSWEDDEETPADEAGVTGESVDAGQEPEVVPSFPIGEYLSGLLRWSGEGAAPADEYAAGPAEDAAEEPGEAAAEEPAGAAPEAGGSEATSPGGEDDDDLETFRSWLESLKQ